MVRSGLYRFRQGIPRFSLVYMSFLRVFEIDAMDQPDNVEPYKKLDLQRNDVHHAMIGSLMRPSDVFRCILDVQAP